jgi:hypothetical protein
LPDLTIGAVVKAFRGNAYPAIKVRGEYEDYWRSPQLVRYSFIKLHGFKGIVKINCGFSAA